MMQSASMKETKKNGIKAEETTLVLFIFGGYLRSKVKCTKCQVSSKHSDRILDLTVEIDGDISTLDGALCRFTSSESLDGDNRCNSFECAHKKLTILEAPNILRIALKRYQSGVLGKISKDVKFPDHLNLSEYICRTDDFNPVYSLCGRGCRWGHTAPLYYGTLSSCSCEHGEDRCLWRFCIFVLALLFQKATKKVTFNRSLIREVAGFAPYEKGTTELLKVWKDKPALNVAKRKLGTQKSELF